MREKRLILVGGGGHCKAVIDVIKSAGNTIFGIIDNEIPVGDKVLDVPVVGGDNDLSSFADHNTEFLITVGQIKSPSIRKRLTLAITQSGGVLAEPVIASTAHIAIGAKIGRGTVVMHNAVVNSDATIGENCIINTGAIIEHDCTVGDFVHISTGAIANGASHIGNDCFVGSHATIAHMANVADNTVVGAGAVVMNDINEEGTYVGIPAKKIR